MQDPDTGSHHILTGDCWAWTRAKPGHTLRFALFEEETEARSLWETKLTWTTQQGMLLRDVTTGNVRVKRALTQTHSGGNIPRFIQSLQSGFEDPQLQNLALSEEENECR
ncbi:hypothetical protein AAFF_G00094690 [Aldrovandia affinis]|uniref:Uncharacterized protein n=1 Tax=Aldrovandia affinis TaxID=143900 RepID=A0AAD7WYC1_9TELE|nr:hypothetical protein AAFF_G00094690 [Aldrovandia affinis]